MGILGGTGMFFLKRMPNNKKVKDIIIIRKKKLNEEYSSIEEKSITQIIVFSKRINIIFPFS